MLIESKRWLKQPRPVAAKARGADLDNAAFSFGAAVSGAVLDATAGCPECRERLTAALSRLCREHGGSEALVAALDRDAA